MHVRPEGVLSFRSCCHGLTVFVMSLFILITIRMCRPVLIKKIAQSFADSLSTDHSPSRHVYRLCYKMPYGCTDFIYHVGSSWDCRSIASAGWLAGGTSGNRGRRTCFFTAVDPMNEPRESPSYGVDVPRMVPYRTGWRHHKVRSAARTIRDVYSGRRSQRLGARAAESSDCVFVVASLFRGCRVFASVTLCK